MSKRRLLGVLFPRKSGSMGSGSMGRHQTLTSKSSTGRSTVDVNPGLSKGSSMESADSTRTNPFPLGDILQRWAPTRFVELLTTGFVCVLSLKQCFFCWMFRRLEQHFCASNCTVALCVFHLYLRSFCLFCTWSSYVCGKYLGVERFGEVTTKGASHRRSRGCRP